MTLPINKEPENPHNRCAPEADPFLVGGPDNSAGGGGRGHLDMAELGRQRQDKNVAIFMAGFSRSSCCCFGPFFFLAAALEIPAGGVGNFGRGDAARESAVPRPRVTGDFVPILAMALEPRRLVPALPAPMPVVRFRPRLRSRFS